MDYLDEHPFLCIQDYMAVTGLKRSSANRELLRLSSDPASGIHPIGLWKPPGVCPQENRGRSLIHLMVPRVEMLASAVRSYQFGGGAFRDLEIELQSLAFLLDTYLDGSIMSL